MALIHATAVAFQGQGILLLGPSGSGKSDLALRLIDEGALLISDDQVDVRQQDGMAIASPPPSIAGLIEARGLGLMRLPYLSQAPLFLAIDLAQDMPIERLPLACTWNKDGIILPLLRLNPFEASTPAKLRLALTAENCSIMPPR
jgi:hypothetical protein